MKERKFLPVKEVYKKELKNNPEIKKQALKWLDEVKRDDKYGLDEEEIENLNVIRLCLEKEYLIPKDFKKLFVELLRDKVFACIGTLNANSDPAKVLSGVDDAHVYSLLYYYYTT